MAFGAYRHTGRLFVGNLPWNLSSQALKQYFEQFGTVKSGKVLFDKQTGFSKRYGWIDYIGNDFIEKVDRVDKHIVYGRSLHLYQKDKTYQIEQKELEQNRFENEGDSF